MRNVESVCDSLKSVGVLTCKMVLGHVRMKQNPSEPKYPC